jgi:hypothetical protein
MSAYRAYVMGKDGHFASYSAFVCANDAHAIVWARQPADGHDVELWSETRFVIRIDHGVEKRPPLPRTPNRTLPRTPKRKRPHLGGC